MKKYMVIANVGGKNYLTAIIASSYSNAEHCILKDGICGKHECTITACMAFDEETMKTDTFIAAALNAYPITPVDLSLAIHDCNEKIRAKDAAENRVQEIEQQMKELADELQAAKRIFDSYAS